MTAYYNENDPFAAQWLRNLIADGHIMQGEVDERSIADVRADDFRGFTRCHFFAGIGGWDYALRLAGWPDDRPVWTGSCPCQPFSVAGKREGHSDERHLWPEFYRLIAECRPATVFGEQVEGAVRHGWLDLVFGDLEREGYACGAAVLGAHSVGAPHIRQRLWWVADANEQSSQWDTGSVFGAQAEVDSKDRPEHGGCVVGLEYSRASGMPGRLADAQDIGLKWSRRSWRWRNGSANGCLGTSGDADAGVTTEGPDCTAKTAPVVIDRLADRIGAGLEVEREQSARDQRAPVERGGEVGVWLEHAAGDGREQRRAEPGGRSAVGGRAWGDVEWLPCIDGKARPAQPGIFPLAHGVPGRVGKLRAYGNAIVPQVAAEFIAMAVERVP